MIVSRSIRARNKNVSPTNKLKVRMFPLLNVLNVRIFPLLYDLKVGMFPLSYDLRVGLFPLPPGLSSVGMQRHPVAKQTPQTLRITRLGRTARSTARTRDGGMI